MTTNGWMQIVVFLALILAITKPLGVFMAKVFSRERTFLDPAVRPIERLLYRVTGVDEEHEMRWTEYALTMLLFSGASMLLLYLIERAQHLLPWWNPQKFAAVPPALAFNTAASFTTNTNWQNYPGEATMSYLTQMAGLAYHNFASAAVGIALAGVAEADRLVADRVGAFSEVFHFAAKPEAGHRRCRPAAAPTGWSGSCRPRNSLWSPSPCARCRE
jgi:potassium-transporting ATPase potassium-binding subunit